MLLACMEVEACHLKLLVALEQMFLTTPAGPALPFPLLFPALYMVFVFPS
jgi:hypothetical protein